MADEFDTEGLEGVVLEGTEDDGQQTRPQGTQPQGPAEAYNPSQTAHNIITYADTSEGGIGDSIKYAAGEFTADGTYRQEEGGIHDTYKRAERAAAWLTIASGDIWQKADAAKLSEYTQSFGGDLKGRLEELKVVSHQEENNFLTVYNNGRGANAKVIPFSDEELQMASEFGVFARQVSGEDFNASEWGILNQCYDNFHNDKATGVIETGTKAREILVSKGISPDDLQGGGVHTVIEKLKGDIGTGHGKVETTIRLTEKERAAIGPFMAEKKKNKMLLNPKTERDNANVMRIIRKAEVARVAEKVNGFNGSQAQLKELLVEHRDKNGDIFHTLNGKKITSKDAYDAMMGCYDKVGATNPTDAASIRSGVLRRAQTVLMGDTARGFNFVRDAGTIAARGASMVYGGYLAALEHGSTQKAIDKLDDKVKDLKTKMTDAQNELQNAILSGDAGQIKKAKKKADLAKDRYWDAEGKHRLANTTKEDIGNVRNARKDAKRGRRSKNEIEGCTSKSDYRAKLKEMKDKRRLQKEETFRNKHGGRKSFSERRRDSRAKRLEMKAHRKPTRFDKLREKVSNRMSGLKATRDAIMKKIRDNTVVKAITGVTNFLNGIKRAIIKAIGGFLLGYMKFAVVVSILMVPVMLLILMFSFGANLFEDKTNYADVLISDMENLEYYFTRLAKGEVYATFTIDDKDALLNEEVSDKDNKFYVNVNEPELTGYLAYNKGASTIPVYAGTGIEYQTHAASNMGSYVPYFGAMRYRYIGEDFEDNKNGVVNKKMYGTAKAYMYLLWLNNHGVRIVEDQKAFLKLKPSYCDRTGVGCDNWEFHVGGGYGYGTQAGNDRCYITEEPSVACVRNGCYCPEPEWIWKCTHKHDKGCYKTEIVYTQGDLCCDGHHNSDCYKENRTLTCKQKEGKKHTHGDGCYTTTYEFVCTVSHHGTPDPWYKTSEGTVHSGCFATTTTETEVLDCPHDCGTVDDARYVEYRSIWDDFSHGNVHYEYYHSKPSVPCWTVQNKYYCKGFCAGHKTPHFYITAYKYFEDIVAHDLYNGPKFVNTNFANKLPFLPNDSEGFGAKMRDKFIDWFKKTFTNGDAPTVAQMKQKVFLDGDSLLNKLNAGDDSLTVNDGWLADHGLTKPWVSQLFAVPSSGGWKKEFVDDGKIMLGNADDGYKDGVEYFAEFGVHFQLDRDTPLSEDEINEWMKKAESAIKTERYKRKEFLKFALGECGHWTWELTKDKEEYSYDGKKCSNTGFVSYVFNNYDPATSSQSRKTSVYAHSYGFNPWNLIVDIDAKVVKVNNLEDALIPGTIISTNFDWIVGDVDQRLAIVLYSEGVDTNTLMELLNLENRHLNARIWVIDCSPFPGKSSIRCLGFDEFRRTYSYYRKP